MVLQDNRRVTLELVVDNLPTIVPNVMFTMPDLADASPTPAKPDPSAPSPDPNIELSILNRQRQPVASLFIVEHKEDRTALTLHIPAPDLQEPYTARAEMTHQDQLLDVIETPFTLDQEGDS